MLVPPPAEVPDEPGRLVKSTRRDLERWAKADSVLGELVLLLARQLDAPGQTGSGVAALSKVFMVFWKELSDAAEREAQDNPLNRLLNRRLVGVPPSDDEPADEPWDPDAV